VVRAILVAVFGVILYASVWSYQNYYFLLFFKRLLTVFNEPDFNAVRLVVAQQPATIVNPILITIAPKQGTTWLGHICFQLRARGAPLTNRSLMVDMPYIEGLSFLPWNLSEWRNVSGNMEPPMWELSKGVEPFLLRTHLELGTLKDLGLFPKYRTITLFRNPMDAVVSSWRFLPNLLHVPHELIDPNLYARATLISKYDETLQNMVDFWDLRNDPNVLILFFDELKEDLGGTVRRVAKFMGLNPALTEEELQKIEGQCTFAGMSGRPRFETIEGKDHVLKMLGLPPGQEVRKGLLVRQGGGKHGESANVLTEDVQQQMHAMWRALVAEKTGMQNYTHFMNTLRKVRAN